MAERWRWLGSPWFLASVVVLVVNDHVLKTRFPGWWTGKVSDVAGLAMMGVVAAVLAGELPGVLLADIGFVALKTVPGAAELVAPVLGGATSRDASDLVALIVLVPTFVLFLRSTHARATAPADDAGRHLRARRTLLCSTVLPILGAGVAMLATTATSCGPRPTVDRLVTDGGVVYAEVTNGYGSPDWARTEDGGRTWTKAKAPPRGLGSFEVDPFETKPAGPLRACAADGTCFRLRDQRIIEVTTPTGDTIDEFTLTEAQLEAISTGCANAQHGVLTSVAASTTTGRPAMASLGADGVVVRDTDGHWSRFGVLGAHRPSPGPSPAFGYGAVAFGPVLALGVLLLMRHRWPSWPAAIGVALGGWFGSIFLGAMTDTLSGPDNNYDVMVVMPAGFVITLVATVLVGRNPCFAPKRRRRQNQGPVPLPPDPPG